MRHPRLISGVMGIACGNRIQLTVRCMVFSTWGPYTLSLKGSLPGA